MRCRGYPAETRITAGRQDRTLRRLRLCIGIAPFFLLLSACRGWLSPCDLVGHDSVRVTVSDSVTGGRPAAELLLILSDGVVADTVKYPPGSGPAVSIGVGLDRKGTFTLTVWADGYLPWIRHNVVVPYDPRCDHDQAKTQTLRVLLVPE